MSSLFNSFLVTVGANVVSYYICKWLDSYRKGQVSPKEPPRSVFFFAMGQIPFVQAVIWQIQLTSIISRYRWPFSAI